jgi:hypothetical protein
MAIPIARPKDVFHKAEHENLTQEACCKLDLKQKQSYHISSMAQRSENFLAKDLKAPSRTKGHQTIDKQPKNNKKMFADGGTGLFPELVNA